MESQTWTAGQAARLSGLTLSMLNYVNRTGVLQPFIPEPHQRGHGKRRRYCFADVVLLRAVGKLTGTGISILRLSEGLLLLQQYREELSSPEVNRRRYLITTGFQAYFADSAAIGKTLEECAGPALVINLDQIRTEVSEAVEALSQSNH